MARTAAWLDTDDFSQLYLGHAVTIVIFQEAPDPRYCMNVNGRLEKILNATALERAKQEAEDVIKEWAASL